MHRDVRKVKVEESEEQRGDKRAKDPVAIYIPVAGASRANVR